MTRKRTEVTVEIDETWLIKYSNRDSVVLNRRHQEQATLISYDEPGIADSREHPADLPDCETNRRERSRWRLVLRLLLPGRAIDAASVLVGSARKKMRNK